MAKNTHQNLEDAFSGESQAHLKYLIYSDKAKEEGNMQAAKLFAAASFSEYIHAKNHFHLLEDKKTESNLKKAISGEDYEREEMYPKMIEIAKKEDNHSAQVSFDFAKRVEGEHSDLFSKVKEGKKVADEFYVCPNCGHVSLNEAPERCPICSFPKDKFKKIEI